MSITESDVRLRASARMTDFTNGGGLMSTTVIVDGVTNNVFDNITDLERLDGKLSLRKIFGAALNSDTSTYLSSHVVVDQPPTDTATSCFAFSTGNAVTERAAAVAALDTASFTVLGAGNMTYVSDGSLTTGDTAITSQAAEVIAGRAFLAISVGGTWYLRTMAVFGSGGFSYTPDAAIPGIATSTSYVAKIVKVNTAAPRAFGVATLTAAASSGSATATVDQAWAYRQPDTGVGEVASFRAMTLVLDDKVLVHSTLGMTAAAVSNSQVVTTGRTTLSRLRVIGFNGTVHGTFTRGQTFPTGLGFTADLDAGTVTFTTVSGLSQPVVVEHRIEELLRLTRVSVGSGVVTFNRGLSRAYPAGTRVSSLLVLGDLQARVSLYFAQTAWASVYTDAVVGSTPAADYNVTGYPLAVTNKGAISERWALIFTNTTSFRIVGELLGEIGTGTTGTDCAPNNPATSAPYFTVLSSGWGSGWTASNVYRFNTVGANAPVWVGRCVAPSTPTGSDAVTLQLRGYTN